MGEKILNSLAARIAELKYLAEKEHMVTEEIDNLNFTIGEVVQADVNQSFHDEAGLADDITEFIFDTETVEPQPQDKIDTDGTRDN
ncbi:hypothetical protein CI610_03127 [invertebrate metagenome]|uniref:Uncharacterized protein n=1 Tax=invertebrate metagenome TaxID=1711999 RepID=A0A2H9T3Z2_9ZZZZ